MRHLAMPIGSSTISYVRCATVVSLCVLSAAALGARQEAPKIKPSQHGTVSQRIADTTITQVYYRPASCW